MNLALAAPALASVALQPTCQSPEHPDRPQVPAPVPTTPTPDWRHQLLAEAETPRGSMALNVDGVVGDWNGYGTWVDAVTSARSLSASLSRAVAVLDHSGRLYLRTLWAAPNIPESGFGRTYSIGALGETAIDFQGTDMRGIVQAARLLTRGDCLDRRIIIH